MTIIRRKIRATRGVVVIMVYTGRMPEKNRIITDDAYLINSSGEYVTAVAATPRRQANRETIEAAP